MSSQVPYTGVPTVQPSFDATPSMQSNVPMEAFGTGVAQAVGHLGRAVEGAGNEIWARATAMQQLNEQANADEAISKFTMTQAKKFADFTMLKGKQAVDGLNPYLEDLEKSRVEIGQNLSSPYAQRLYLHGSKSEQARNAFAVARHAGDEGRQYNLSSAQAIIEANVQSAGLAPQNEESYQNALKVNLQNAQKQADIAGKDSQWAENLARAENSRMTLTRVRSLARIDVAGAQKLIDAASKAGNLFGEELGKAQDFVRTQRLSVATRQEAARARSGDNTSLGDAKLPIDQVMEAVAGNEGADYSTKHPPVTHKVNGKTITEYGLGRWGVMQSNLQPWLKEAGMPAMTEQEFLNSPEAQKQLVKFKLQQFQEEGGSANAAAMKWFTGDYNPDPSRNDKISNAGQYKQRFNANLFRQGGASFADAAGRARSKQLFGDDPEAEEAMSQHFVTVNKRDKQLAREDLQENIDTIENAIVPAKDGKLVTSIEDVQDPKVQAAWDALPIPRQNRYRQLLSRNAKNDYTETPENQNEYRKWLGRLTDPMASPEERRDAMNQEFAFMNLPANQRQQLNMLKRAMWKSDNKAQNPALNHAMSVSNDILRQAGIDRSKTKDDYDLIRGTMFTILQQRAADGNPVKNDQEYREITSGLVRQVNQTKLFGTLWGGTQAFKVEVPKQEREKIINNYMQRYDREPKDKEIQEIYNAGMYNALYSKAKKMQSDRNAVMSPTSSMGKPEVPRSQ